MESIAVLVVFLGAAGTILAYPNGAPTIACQSMFPTGHKVDAQKSSPPYTIKTSQNSYANNNITVTLEPTDSVSGYYEGVFVQARRAKCDTNYDPVGTIVVSDAQLFKTIDCGSGQKNAFSHSTKDKKKVISFTWIPPSSSVGTVYFRGTFVKETDEFWTTVSSDFINDGQPSSDDEKCPVQTMAGAAGTTIYAHYLLCICYIFACAFTR